MNKKVMKYPDGGEVPPKTRKAAYDPNKELTAGINKTLAYDQNRSAKDVILAASKRGNIDPAFLLSSAWQEGFNKAVYKPDEISEAYDIASKKDKSLANYPVDGFYNYGLDTFGNNYDKLKKYLPADFTEGNNFKLFDALNEKNEKIKTVAFKNNEDALVAKAAFLNSMKDDVVNYAKNKGIDISNDPEAQKYFTLVSYNGGFGNAQKSINEYALAKDKKAYFQGQTKLQGIYKNIAPRLERQQLANQLLGIQQNAAKQPVQQQSGTMKAGGKMRKMDDGGEIDPITGKPKEPTLNGAKNVGIDVWGNAMNTPVPINPNAPKDQQIFKIDEQKGSPVPAEQIIPLSQFADVVAGKFGQQDLKGTGKYVNDQGQVNTLADAKEQAADVSANNVLAADEFSKNLATTELIAGTGISAINAFFNKKEAAKEQRTNLRKAIMQEQFGPVFNPYAEGTGSQAIMESGGTIHIKPENRGKFNATKKRTGKTTEELTHSKNPLTRKRAIFAQNAAKWHKGEDGLDLEPDNDEDDMQILGGGQAQQISGPDDPMFEFKGNTHKEGGIGLAFGGKVAEVEKGEVGYVDDAGSLNIFGKMKVPGTNKTFKKAAKDMAEAQLKVDKKRGYYAQILNNSDEADKYQNTATSTAKVMLMSLDKQAEEIKQNKEALASYQTLVLDMAGKDENIMAYGGKMPKKPAYLAEGGNLDPKDPASVQKIIDKYSNGKSPLKAEDFIEVSNKYGVPLDLMLAQAIAESNIGTQGRAVRTKNIFNVGNTDDGKENNQSSWKAGLENYAQLIKNEYATDPNNITTQDILNNDFTQPKKGGRYATAKYTPQVAKILKEINPGSNYTFSSTSNNAAGDPGDEFKQFKGKDGKQYTSPTGLKPSVFYKDPAIAKALEADQTFPKAGADANWGPEHDKLWNSLPQEKKDELLNKSKEVTPTKSNTPLDNSATNFKPKYETITKIDGTKDTPYGPAQKDPTQFRDQTNLGNGERRRGYLSPLALEQIAPELLTVATNKRQAVPQLSYQPELKQTFDISYQLGRNENQSVFNQVAKSAELTGNVDALGQLAANLYKANEQYNMQEVQGNAQQKLGVYGQNVDTLNDAKLKNLQLIENQQNKQAAADYNTWKTDIAAFTSVAGKELQNKLENKTYNAYANLFKHYGFDKKGNVTFNPDDVVQRFSPGEAQQFGLLSAQKGLKDIMEAGSKTATTYDANGNIKKITSIDSDLEEFNSIWNSKSLDESQKRTILSNRKNSVYESLQEKQ
jgi:YD repeat-containing protein